MAPGLKITLEPGRDRNDEHEPTLVHRVPDFAGLDQLGVLEARRIEGFEHLFGQGRLVLIGERDRGIVDLVGGAGRLRVNRPGERIDDEQHQHHVAQ